LTAESGFAGRLEASPAPARSAGNSQPGGTGVLAGSATALIMGYALALVLTIVLAVLAILCAITLAPTGAAVGALSITFFVNRSTVEPPLHTYLAGNWFRD